MTELINWSTQLAVGHEDMDNTHREFIKLVNQLHTADKTTFQSLFATLIQHTEVHFATENALMENSRFPATTVHQAEHHRVLAEMKQFQTRVNKGLLSMGRAYIQERLPEWFSTHAQMMDAALAFHIKQGQK